MTLTINADEASIIISALNSAARHHGIGTHCNAVCVAVAERWGNEITAQVLTTKPAGAVHTGSGV